MRANRGWAGLRRALPVDDADELAWLLFQQDDVISLDQTRRHLSPKATRHRIASGRWRPAHRAILVAHSGPISADQHRWIAVLAAGPTALLGGLTAARICGLRGYDSRVIHVLLPARQQIRALPPGVRVHRTTLLPVADVHPSARPPRTRAARSLVDAAQWAATDAEARAIIAAGFQQRLVAGDDLRHVLGRLPRAHRRRLIQRTAADAAGGAHSLAELDFLDLVRRAGLPEPSRQTVRRDAAGHRRYLDVWFEEWRVHVEIDGGQHLDPRTAWADMRRQNDLWMEGDRVLRFAAWAIRADPEEVVRQLRAALKAAGWPG
ncbi:endonuclease domain-containing protein [Micromonospora sp. GCM10011542]|uniref:endonuclease domain-containing protein n=1 Tax=Micromonospora sp. GCM10011542 TaxID=3317337 RepID=UPI00361C1DE8